MNRGFNQQPMWNGISNNQQRGPPVFNAFQNNMGPRPGQPIGPSMNTQLVTQNPGTPAQRNVSQLDLQENARNQATPAPDHK